MARTVVPLNCNAFLEKAKLKDDGSNYTDWVPNLRIILIAAQKNYVLEAPLGDKPTSGATPDVMNVWQSKADDYSIVQCAMLYGLELWLQRRFERHGAYEMFQELKLIFQANARIERCEVSNKFYSCKMEENSSVSEYILRMSGYPTTWLSWELIFLIIVSLTEFFNDCHQATRASWWTIICKGWIRLFLISSHAKGCGGRNQKGASSVDGQ